MPTLQLTNANVFDGISDELLPGRSVLIEGDRIVEVAEGSASTTADLIAVRGNPLEDIELLAANGSQLSLIIKGRSVHKHEP
jgi:hypothetical protein